MLSILVMIFATLWTNHKRNSFPSIRNFQCLSGLMIIPEWTIPFDILMIPLLLWATCVIDSIFSTGLSYPTFNMISLLIIYRHLLWLKPEISRLRLYHLRTFRSIWYLQYRVITSFMACNLPKDTQSYRTSKNHYWLGLKVFHSIVFNIKMI